MMVVVFPVAASGFVFAPTVLVLIQQAQLGLQWALKNFL